MNRIIAVTAAALWIGSTVSSSVSQPVIRVWYGPDQKVAYGGSLDDWYLVGNVEKPDSIASVKCVLNGGSPKNLTFNSTLYRLSRRGNYIADFPIRDMVTGTNSFELTAQGIDGSSTTTTVNVDLESGSCPRTLDIRWPNVSDIQDVGMVGDGKWEINSEGLHTVEPGYDRVVFIGNNTWHDFEVTARLKIHRFNGVGLCGFVMRFKCHYAVTNDQPKWGYVPLGALCWMGNKSASAGTVRPQFAHGTITSEENLDEIPLSLGTWTWIKARCETIADDPANNTTKYSFKVWRDTEKEPEDWIYQRTVTDIQNGSVRGLRAGSIGLISHMAEATFGRTIIRPVGIDSADETAPRRRMARSATAAGRYCALIPGGRIRITPRVAQQVSVTLVTPDGKTAATVFRGFLSGPAVIPAFPDGNRRSQGVRIVRVRGSDLREDLLVGAVR